MYNRNYTGLTREDALELLATNSTPEVIPCQYGWKYDDSQYESSIVTEVRVDFTSLQSRHNECNGVLKISGDSIVY